MKSARVFNFSIMAYLILYTSSASASFGYFGSDLNESLEMSALKMFITLAIVVALAYLVLQKGLGSFLDRQRVGQRIQVKERISLGSRQGLFLVKIDEREIVLSTSDKGVELLLELGPLEFNEERSVPVAPEIFRNNAPSR